MRIRLVLAALFLGGAAVSAPSGRPVGGNPKSGRIVLPTRFDEDRVYVLLRTAKGGTVELYTDSGGGGLILSQAAADRLGLVTGPSTDPEVKAELGPDARVAAAPRLASGLPPLPPAAVIAPKARQIPGWPEQGDGFLGAPWFAGGVWTWDYPGQRLIREAKGKSTPRKGRTVALGFKTEANGTRPTNFARISIRIDGRELPMLLDTGAETLLTPAALAQIGDRGPAMRATSMIAASVFDDWRKRHPSWRYIEDAQVGTHSAMIEVPSAGIAGYSTGPVWFTRRSDASFHDFMSSMMDAQVEGSIGGNLLRHFIMTVDYPAARATFECRTGC